MIFIAGASGFVGGHLTDYLITKGHKLKCLARSEKAKKSLSEKGVEVISGDITKAETLRGVLSHNDLVIHLVGIMEEKWEATFQRIHIEGTKNLVVEAQRSGVRRFFYQSALGADSSSWSGYLRTKAEAEELVRQSGLNHTIFRPSLITGPWDDFTKKLIDILKLSPVIPIPGEGRAKFQPVYIKDWLKCAEKVIENPDQFIGTYDIGGPEHLTYRQIVETLAKAMGRSRLSFAIPMGLMKLSAALLGSLMSRPPVTGDQLRLLEQDNICDPKAIEKNFGFAPVKYEDALKEFISG